MPHSIALVCLHLAVVLFGFAALFGKWIAWDPVGIVFGRTVVAALALGLWLRLQRRAVLRPTWALAISGVLLALHWVAFFKAVAVGSVTMALLGYASFPLFVLALESTLHARRWHRVDLATALLVVGGLALTVPEWRWSSASVQGLAWGILSGFTFAWLVVRARVIGSAMPASSLAFWLNVFAALCLLPVVIGAGGVGGALDLHTAVLVLALGLLCTALAHTLYIVGIAGAGSLPAAVIAALEPVYGITLAWMWLAEVPGVRTALGATLLVAAAIVASVRARPPVLP